jgi:acetyl-CoA carboxylase carboxyl transferase subunit alpha
LGAEERNQSEAIARNLLELSTLSTITISVVIGEGGSGGALAIGVADRLAMMRYSVFSVISPEGCSAILWNDPAKVEAATKALKITSSDLKSLDLIDDVIDEPLIGAHRDKMGAAKALKVYFLTQLTLLRQMEQHERLEKRYARLVGIGQFSE